MRNTASHKFKHLLWTGSGQILKPISMDYMHIWRWFPNFENIIDNKLEDFFKPDSF